MSVDVQAPEIGAALALVEASLESERIDRDIPGISAGIVYDQTLIWHKGYGHANLAEAIPADHKTVYRVASITKLFTSTMLMLLRDAGRLNLDDPVESVLAAYKMPSSFGDARPPTFRQLASHATGMPREGAHRGWRDMNMPTIDDLLRSLQEIEMSFPLMTEPKYSNLGIAILGHALSLVAGVDYAEYVRRHILEPLGMKDSGFLHTDYNIQQRAIGYYRPRRDADFEAAPHWDEQGFRPAGGMYSTVEDIARFIALQFREGEAGGEQILSSASLREMHAPIIISPDFETGFGLGWGIRRVAGHKVIGHSGGLPGYTTNISLIPGMKLAAIVFTNTGTNPVEISESLLKILIPAFTRAAARQGKPTAEQLNSWKVYLGRYALRTMDDAIEIKIINDHLTVVMPDGNPAGNITLLYHDRHRFRMRGGSSSGELLIFETDADDNVTGLVLGSYPFDRVND